MSFTPEQITEILQIYFDNFVSQTYTGMRYVPIIGRRGESSAAWDNTAPYEPLTIVTYSNESYTSRQYVPAGVAITNTDYWVKTGAYNAQIAELQDALPIAQFDSENTVKDYVDELASFIPATDFDNDNTVKAYIDGFADLLPSSAFDSVNTVRGAINEVKDVLPFTDFDDTNTVKKYIDDNLGLSTLLPSSSFSNTNTVEKLIKSRAGFNGANIMCVNDSWGSSGVYDVTKPYLQMVCEALNANYIDLHQGSTGFITGNNYLTRIQTWCTNNADQVPFVNYMFIQGSINDYSETISDIRTAINNLITWVKANMPNTTMIFIPPFMPADMNLCSVASNSVNYWQEIYAALTGYFMQNVQSKWIVLWNISGVLLTKTSLMYNEVHPNQTGHNLLAKAVIAALSGGNCYTPLFSVNTAANLANHITFKTNSDVEITPAECGVKCYISNGIFKCKGFVSFNETAASASSIRMSFKHILPISKVNDLRVAGNNYRISSMTSLSAVNTASYAYNSTIQPISAKTYTSGDYEQMFVDFVTNRILTANVKFSIEFDIDFEIMNYLQ